MGSNGEKPSDKAEVAGVFHAFQKNYDMMFKTIKELRDSVNKMSGMIAANYYNLENVSETLKTYYKRISVIEQQRKGQVELNVKSAKYISELLSRASTMNNQYDDSL